MQRRSTEDIQERSARSIKNIEIEMSENLEGCNKTMNESATSSLNQTQEVVALKSDRERENSEKKGRRDSQQKAAA